MADGRPALPQQLDLIDGEREEPALTGIMLNDPDTGEDLGRSAVSRPESVEAAIVAADHVAASSAWSAQDFGARTNLLTSFADVLDERQEELAAADTVDSGVPITVTRMFAGGLSDVVHEAVTHARRLKLHRSLADNVGLHLLPWVRWRSSRRSTRRRSSL